MYYEVAKLKRKNVHRLQATNKKEQPKENR